MPANDGIALDAVGSTGQSMNLPILALVIPRTVVGRLAPAAPLSGLRSAHLALVDYFINVVHGDLYNEMCGVGDKSADLM